jgi:hypothetical protein
MAGAMMQGGMKSQMPQMIIEQEEIGKLVNELMKSLAAIQNEKDSAALKKKLAQHDELLRSLQTKVQSQSRMMNMMQHMMSGSMMGRGGSSETKK